MAKKRGPYRKQGRKYEAILEGIRKIARADARQWPRVLSNECRYTRADYRQAYAEAYLQQCVANRGPA